MGRLAIFLMAISLISPIFGHPKPPQGLSQLAWTQKSTPIEKTQCFSAEKCKEVCQNLGYEIGDDASGHSFTGQDQFYSPGCFLYVSGKYEKRCFYGLEGDIGHPILSFWNTEKRFVCTSTPECLDS